MSTTEILIGGAVVGLLLMIVPSVAVIGIGIALAGWWIARAMEGK
jgi:hypothetical protein